MLNTDLSNLTISDLYVHSDTNFAFRDASDFGDNLDFQWNPNPAASVPQFDPTAECCLRSLETPKPFMGHNAQDSTTSPFGEVADDERFYYCLQGTENLYEARTTPEKVSDSTVASFPKAMDNTVASFPNAMDNRCYYYNPQTKVHSYETPSILGKARRARSCTKRVCEWLVEYVDDMRNHEKGCVRWANQQELVFKVLKTKEVAKAWGLTKKGKLEKIRKPEKEMDWSKLARALRYYYPNNRNGNDVKIIPDSATSLHKKRRCVLKFNKKFYDSVSAKYNH